MRRDMAGSFMRRFFPLFFLGPAGARAGDVEIRGRVVDEGGKPVAGATVDYSWRANGAGRDRDGKGLNLSKEENVKLFWSHLGEMMQMKYPAEVRSGPDGRFTLKMPEIF